jgi:hypothetical protein
VAGALIQTLLPKVVRCVVLEECSEVFRPCAPLYWRQIGESQSGRDMLGRENALDLRGIVDLTRFRGCVLYPWLLFGAPSVMS